MDSDYAKLYKKKLGQRVGLNLDEDDIIIKNQQGITQIPKFRTALEKQNDEIYQTNQARENLRTIMLPNDINKSIAHINDINDLATFNAFFTEFKKQLKGRREMTPSEFLVNYQNFSNNMRNKKWASITTEKDKLELIKKLLGKDDPAYLIKEYGEEFRDILKDLSQDVSILSDKFDASMFEVKDSLDELKFKINEVNEYVDDNDKFNDILYEIEKLTDKLDVEYDSLKETLKSEPMDVKEITDPILGELRTIISGAKEILTDERSSTSQLIKDLDELNEKRIEGLSEKINDLIKRPSVAIEKTNVFIGESKEEILYDNIMMEFLISVFNYADNPPADLNVIAKLLTDTYAKIKDNLKDKDFRVKKFWKIQTKYLSPAGKLLKTTKEMKPKRFLNELYSDFYNGFPGLQKSLDVSVRKQASEKIGIKGSLSSALSGLKKPKPKEEEKKEESLAEQLAKIREKREKKGSGLHPEGLSEIPKFIILGRYCIDYPRLQGGNITLRTKGKKCWSKTIAKFTGKKISSLFRNFLLDFLSRDGKISKEKYEKLRDVEKNEFKQLLILCKLPIKDIIDIEGSGMGKQSPEERFEVLRGQIIAGNNSRRVKNEFIEVLEQLNRLNKITYSEMRDILEKL